MILHFLYSCSDCDFVWLHAVIPFYYITGTAIMPYVTSGHPGVAHGLGAGYEILAEHEVGGGDGGVQGFYFS